MHIYAHINIHPYVHIEFSHIRINSTFVFLYITFSDSDQKTAAQTNGVLTTRHSCVSTQSTGR